MYRDRAYPLSCTVDPVKPDASVYWRIGDELQLQTTTDHSLNPDGKTYRLEGTVEAILSEFASPVLVECLVTKLGEAENILMEKEYKMVDIWCKYTADVLLSIYVCQT